MGQPRRAVPKLRHLPNLDRVHWSDLRRPLRLLDLYWQAVKRGMLQHSEATLLNFAGAARYSIEEEGSRQAAAELFREIVEAGAWGCVTQEQEDRAHEALGRTRERYPRAFVYEYGVTRRVANLGKSAPKQSQVVSQVNSLGREVAASLPRAARRSNWANQRMRELVKQVKRVRPIVGKK